MDFDKSFLNPLESHQEFVHASEDPLAGLPKHVWRGQSVKSNAVERRVVQTLCSYILSSWKTGESAAQKITR